MAITVVRGLLRRTIFTSRVSSWGHRIGVVCACVSTLTAELFDLWPWFLLWELTLTLSMDFWTKGLYNLGNAGGTWTFRRFHSVHARTKCRQNLDYRLSKVWLRGGNSPRQITGGYQKLMHLLGPRKSLTTPIIGHCWLATVCLSAGWVLKGYAPAPSKDQGKPLPNDITSLVPTGALISDNPGWDNDCSYKLQL